MVLCFVYALEPVFFPLNTTRIIILLVITSIILRKEPVRFPYHPGTFMALVPVFLFLIYATLGTLFTSARNTEVFANMFLTIFQIGFGAYLVASFFFNDDFSLDKLLFIFVIIFAIQGLLSLPNLLIPPYKDFMNNIFPLGGNIQTGMIEATYRVRGLMMGIGSAYASHMSLGFLFSAYLLSSRRFDKQDKIIVTCCLPFILIGILFMGRTGLVMIPVALVLYYLLLFVNGTFEARKLLPLIWAPIAAAGIYSLLKWIYLSAGGDNYLLGLWETWAFGTFEGIFTSGSDQLQVLDKLKQHFFIPESDFVLVLGNPETWSDSFSDIGYIKYLFAGGIIGASLNYLGHICIYLQLVFLSRNIGKQLLFLFLLLWMLVIEYKEPTLNNYLYVSTVMLMLFVSMRFDTSAEDEYTRVFAAKAVGE